jgi:CHAT domain-containing protein/tetratricopeptide (TPR) repeat protein
MTPQFAHRIKLFLALTCAFLLSGCGGNLPASKYWLDGEYDKAYNAVSADLRKNGEVATYGYSILCDSMHKLRKYDEVLGCVERFDARIAQGNTSDGFGNDLSSHPKAIAANVHIDLGDFLTALEIAREGVRIDASRNTAAYYRVLNHTALGIAAYRLERAEIFEAAVKNLEALQGSFNVGGDAARNALSSLYLLAGRHQEAFALAEKGSSAFLRSSEKWHATTSRFIAASALRLMNRNAEALARFDSLVRDRAVQTNGALLWKAYYYLAGIYRDINRPEQSIAYFKRAVDVIEQQRSTIDSEANKIGFAGNKQAVYGEAVAALVRAGRVEEAFEFAERGKARALVDLLASKKHFSGGGVDPRKVSALLAKQTNAELRAVSHPTGAATRGVAYGIGDEIAQISPNLASLVTVRAASTRDIQGRLPVGDTLIEYYGTADTLFAFVLTKDRIGAVKLDAADLREEVFAFRSLINQPRSAGYRGVGSALFERLIAPLDRMIGGSNLTIVPHGTLHYLPFGALPFGGGHLVDRFNIRVLPNASVLEFLRERGRGQPGDLLAFGNPDLGDKTLDLPAAQIEAIRISKNRERSTALLRREATESVVHDIAGGFRYLHIASHGTFEGERPLASALLLARDPLNDGRLTVGELYDLNLNADLVTLSACETALGKIANGDDVIGFTRGFLYAGASSIVSTLWQVDDAATAHLMEAFYRHLRKLDKRTALRRAQLDVKRTYNDHPFYWAAFQLTGGVR